MTLKQLWSVLRGRRTNYRLFGISWTSSPGCDPLGNDGELKSEINRLTALLAKIGRSWSSGADESFGGRFLCIHGLTEQEKDDLVDAGLAALALSSNHQTPQRE